jgi:hypothetical protein
MFTQVETPAIGLDRDINGAETTRAVWLRTLELHLCDDTPHNLPRVPVIAVPDRGGAQDGWHSRLPALRNVGKVPVKVCSAVPTIPFRPHRASKFGGRGEEPSNPSYSVRVWGSTERCGEKRPKSADLR